MIDNTALKKLIETVMFYGSPKAPLWFIGLEETDGGSEHKIKKYMKRLDLLDDLDSVSLRDAVGLERYFPSREEDLPEIQKTWEGYVKLKFAIDGLPFVQEQLRRYQGHELGNVDAAEICLTEFLPLPRMNRKEKWIYGEITEVDYLKTQEQYLKHVGPQRVRAISERILQYKPDVVVFFGEDSRNEFWHSLTLEEVSIKDSRRSRPIYYGQLGQSLVVFSHHPTAPGISNEYWQSFGQFLSERNTIA